MRGLLIIAAICAALLPQSITAQVFVSFVDDQLTVNETFGVVSVCVEIVEGTVDVNSRITLTTTAISATAGTDFTPFDDIRRTFMPGDTLICEPFMARQDGDVEGTETVDVVLSSTDLSIRGPNTILITILDTDRITVGFDPVSYSVIEGGSTVSVCASRLSGIISRELTLTFTPIANSGNASLVLGSEDYLAGPISVDLLEGSTEACAMFGAIDDNLNPILEEIEFYQISLTTGDNADIEPNQSVADILIIDNDAATVSIETTTFSMPEGDFGELTAVEVCVILEDIQNGLLRTLEFTLFVNLDTAASDDFTPTTPQTIVFESDSVVNEMRCVEYEIIGDDFKELDETLTIDLIGDDPVDVIAGAAQVSITIEDDEDLVQFCEMLEDPVNGTVSTTETIEGTVAEYSCILGHVLSSDAPRVCERNANQLLGSWSNVEPTCDIADCQTPPPPSPNGDIQFTTTTYLSEANYSCTDICYQLVPDEPTLVCQETEMWSPVNAPVCELTDCEAPPDIDDCMVTVDMTVCNSEAMYVQDDQVNFRIFGDTTLTCGIDGNWQTDPGEVLPFCITRGICPEPPPPTGGDCTFDISDPIFMSLEAGAIAQYSCPVGCTLNTTMTTRECIMLTLTEGEWSGFTPQCIGVTCPALPDPLNGMVNDDDLSFDSIANYSCDVGFMIEGNSTQTCGADGNWTGSPPLCVPVECPINRSLSNGNVTVIGINPGDIVTYTCNVNFTLVGSDTRTCETSGSLSGSDPECFMDCGADDDGINFPGTQDNSEVIHGTDTVFTCDSDECSGTRMCNNGTWSGIIPNCNVPRCPELSPEDDSVDNRVTNISYSSAPILAGTVATYTCEDGVVDNANTRTCGCNGQWSAEPRCRDGGSGGDDFPIGAIIGIAIAGALLLVILVIILICCCVYCIKSRNKNSDKQLENYYRDFMRPYATPYDASNPEGAPIVDDTLPRQEEPPVQEMEKEVMRSEDFFHEDDEDEPCSPTPSDEDMEEYRLRLHDVETGSQRRIKPRIVAEKVEVDI